jgi:hypothetical protein
VETSTAQAWLLEFGGDRVAAVGLHELVEVLSRPKLYHVPMTVNPCHQVLVWRDEVLPVMNFISAGEPDDELTEGAPVTAIAAYQLNPGMPVRHGALELGAMPKTVTVDDGMSCQLPDAPGYLATLAISCFSYENFAVPVIDLARAFEGS